MLGDADISIHALCEEGDRAPLYLAYPRIYFYPRPLRGGRRSCLIQPSLTFRISIHALCEEGDALGARDYLPVGISIHALCEEGDRLCPMCQWRRSLFLSTPSARRATYLRPDDLDLSADFYPRPLRGGRRPESRRPARCTYFYPRPLRGGRPGQDAGGLAAILFLSTPSARRATA